jgi:hypothetical protein
MIWRFRNAGYPCCCLTHARHFWMTVWDLGDDYETSFKLSLN